MSCMLVPGCNSYVCVSYQIDLAVYAARQSVFALSSSNQLFFQLAASVFNCLACIVFHECHVIVTSGVSCDLLEQLLRVFVNIKKFDCCHCADRVFLNFSSTLQRASVQFRKI